MLSQKLEFLTLKNITWSVLSFVDIVASNHMFSASQWIQLLIK